MQKNSNVAHRLLLRSPRNLIFEKVNIAESLSGSEFRCQTLLTAISMGTELAAYRGDPPLRPSQAYPRLLGYCNVGLITDVGSAVEGLSVGDRIYTNMPHQSAFQCNYGDLLAKVPKEVSDEEASFAYIAHLGLAALQRADFKVGETAAVIGLGPVGLACIAVIKALGGKAVAVGHGERRLSVARVLGADCAIDGAKIDVNCSPEGPPYNLDVIVNTANSWSAWRTSMVLACFRTRISVLGFPGRTEGKPDFNPLDSAYLYDKQLVISGDGIVGNGEGPATNASLRENMSRVMGMLKEKKLILYPLVSHRISWNELQMLYEKVIRGSKDYIGVVVDWSN